MLGPPRWSVTRRRAVRVIGVAVSGVFGRAPVATGPVPAAVGVPAEAGVAAMSGVDPPTEPPTPATAGGVSFGIATPSTDATARPRTSVMLAGFWPGTFWTVVICTAGATVPLVVFTGC